jgi:hypothetical protein
MPACHREYKSSLKINFLSGTQKKWDVVGFLVVRKVRIGFRYFIRLTFQARPFHGLRVAMEAKNHLLTANHDYDVENLGSQMTSDGNLRRGELLAHGRVVPNKWDRRESAEKPAAPITLRVRPGALYRRAAA